MTLSRPEFLSLNKALIGAVVLGLSQQASPLDAPAIAVGSHKQLWLQIGDANDAYWVEDDAWGAGSLVEGTASDQYEQSVGVHPAVGKNGEVAFRMKWRWPNPPGSGEVKAYPSILSGKKPGYYSADNLVNGKPVRLPDGTHSTVAPSGATPETFFPLQLPLKSLKTKFATKEMAAPTGRGQLAYDIWLQSAPTQDREFRASSITHEIMIPLANWGNYGAHPNGRNPAWYDHDAVIDGRLYHVYATKGPDGALLYDFGRLNGAYGRTGWKMIAFVPDVLPVPAGEIDLAAIINYITTRNDTKGNPWAVGNEYVSSVELGVEPVEGTGDIVVYDYKVSR